METDQYTHPRVFNLSACPSTHWTDPYLPLETVHIKFHITTPNSPQSSPIPTLYTVIYLTLYRFCTSQHPTLTLPSKSHFIYRDTHAYKQPPPPTVLSIQQNTHITLGRFLIRISILAKNCKISTLNRPTCRRAPYFIHITCHSVYKT